MILANKYSLSKSILFFHNWDPPSGNIAIWKESENIKWD